MIENLLQKLASAMTEHRKQTGLDLSEAYFELRMHPEDYDYLRRWRGVHSVFDPPVFHGFAIIVDTSKAQGHPELACTWRWVL